ncbi:Crp/Fnr family transcriptional regulator [Paracrocinitomix mangrovi]|uniref:Crp/Fnr family transcriptional regulator n=1 Tax=Paracrocinitomix mangrovi TaxID=2862509 RepID=UPI001C8E9FA9|nr:Crp/Fnr family transcriptional regulator [Paracrocinitomix mangrovi]UKN00224.1 Crp/Fnr family transcriptional regulator [Paracrocinitomix mangrovi]
MFNKFKQYLTEKEHFSNEELELIQSVASTKNLRKHQYLLQEGEVCKYNIFVVKGLLKAYHVDDKGVEHIVQFAPENHWTGDRESLQSGQPSKLNIDAIENSEVIMFTNSDLKMLRDNIPSFNKMSEKITNMNVLTLEGRIYANITLSTEEKYYNFIEQHPSLIQRIPQHMIASYLGVSPETLSRIRSNSAKNN